MKPKVFGLGAGGHAKVVIEALKTRSNYELIGILDTNIDLHGSNILGVSILGGDDLLPQLYHQGVRLFFVSVGSTGISDSRQRLFTLCEQYGFEAARVIHTSAIISPSAQIGDGTVILAGAIVNAGAIIGRNVIVNTGVIVEHDCQIGNHVHIATGARLAGTVSVGEGAHIGAGATLKQGVKVGDSAIVGAGAVVINDVASNITVVGVPAKPIVRNGFVR